MANETSRNRGHEALSSDGMHARGIIISKHRIGDKAVDERLEEYLKRLDGVLDLCLDDEREGLRIAFEGMERRINDQLTRCLLRGGD